MAVRWWYLNQSLAETGGGTHRRECQTDSLKPAGIKPVDFHAFTAVTLNGHGLRGMLRASIQSIL